ncbi:hypothetical protein [Streptomyces sp. t39]|uniref:hypothetical protein n=1 Tax=Streptomyces sp. t39 TaxID=1828156 RepID=UPI0011CE5082|nr:hypothetical protein [Streptomyces sp. t39]TXS57450.1 hypothetical protein EAO77_16305 [Streptomyces sp. t39]
MSGELPDGAQRPISDEEWARFQIDSEGPARLHAPKEPSARARMVTERLRRADEEEARRQGRVRRLARRGRPVQARPDGWRSWTAAPARRPRGRLRAFLWILLAVAGVLLLLAPGRVLGLLG